MSSDVSTPRDVNTFDYRYDVFISCAAPDRDWVEKWLLPKLENYRIRVCIGYRDLPLGVPKTMAVQEAIETSQSVLFVLTPAYLADEWSQFESQLSLHTHFGERRGKLNPIKTSTSLGETLERARRNGRTIPLQLVSCPLPPWFDCLVKSDFTVPERHMVELDRLIKTIVSLRFVPGPEPRPKVDGGWPDGAIQSFAWKIRYALPNKAYREFVGLHLLQSESGVDPFERELSASVQETAYVVRRVVEAELGQWGSQIVIGPTGAGKTMLAERLSRSLSPQNLVVRCSLDGRNETLALGDDRSSVGARIGDLIPRQVFDAYIKLLLEVPAKQPSSLARLRRSRNWMEHLRRLNQVFRPVVMGPTADFELFDWLVNAPTFRHLPTSADAFPGLISFLTHPESISGLAGSARQYEGVLLLLDVSGRLSLDAIAEIAHLAQMDSKHLSLKLFAREGHAAEIVRHLDVIGPGRLAVYDLPPWHEGELRELLAKRLLEWTSGAWNLDNWAERLPDGCLQLAAKRKFVDIIVAGALRAYESGRIKEDRGHGLAADLDGRAAAPLHALALARGLIAACGGCLGQDGTIAHDQRPLSISQLKALVDEYWAID